MFGEWVAWRKTCGNAVGMGVIRQIAEVAGVEVVTCCLMDNHLHIIAKVLGSISKEKVGVISLAI